MYYKFYQFPYSLNFKYTKNKTTVFISQNTIDEYEIEIENNKTYVFMFLAYRLITRPLKEVEENIQLCLSNSNSGKDKYFSIIKEAINIYMNDIAKFLGI